MAKPQLDSSYHFKVLIVDDDLTILSLLKEIIAMVPGVEVFTASRPDEAMKIILSDSVDIVFTDIHMPGVTGIEMIEDIVALDKTPEIVVMTAYPSSEIAHSAMELGASSLLAKPFEDISLVELEVDKAIKKILRQRASAAEAEEKKKELAQINAKSKEGKDPALPVSLPHQNSADIPVADSEVIPNSAERMDSDTPLQPCILHPPELLEPLVEIEILRCQRSKRQFALGFVDLPENLSVKSRSEREAYEKEQLSILQTCFRTSDVAIDAKKDGIAVIGFECNKPGSHVLEFKLTQAGFQYHGFAVYPNDGQDYQSLYRKARASLQDKRRYRIVVLEPEEFFGRIVQNMLSDPKYNVTWLKDTEEANKHIDQFSENIRIFVLSLSKDPKQWGMLANWKKQSLSNWPIILFTDVSLNDSLKSQLQKLGVKAIVRKGASQEEFLYVIQSFIMQPSVSVIRKNPRALVTLPAVYRFEAKEVSSNTFTISREGVFIRELNPPPPGSQIDIELFIPQQKTPIKCKGEVIYSVPYFVGVSRIHVAGMAIKFLNLPEAQKQVLDQFIASALTSYLIDQ